MYKPSIAPIGWNSWDCYGASVTEETVRKNAEFMAKHLKNTAGSYPLKTASLPLREDRALSLL